MKDNHGGSEHNVHPVKTDRINREKKWKQHTGETAKTNTGTEQQKIGVWKDLEKALHMANEGLSKV